MTQTMETTAPEFRPRPTRSRADAMRIADALARQEASYTGSEGYDDYHGARFRYLLELARTCVPSPDAAVLDIGRSTLSTMLCNAYADVTTLGFPLAPDDRWGDIPHVVYNLNDAQARAPIPTDRTFDLIVMAEVIEHIHTAPELVLLMLQTVLKESGVLICQTPNAAALHKRVKALAGANPYEALRLNPTNPGHFREYTRGELIALGDKVGLTTVRHEFRNYFTGGGNAVSQALFRAACWAVPGFRRGQTVVYRAAGQAAARDQSFHHSPQPEQTIDRTNMTPNNGLSRRAMIVATAGGAAAMPALAAGPALGAQPDSATTASFSHILPEGAFGDGRSHPLSERFSTLKAAQAVYPCATDLTDEIDWCAIQTAIDTAEKNTSGLVHVPNGGQAYILNRGLRVNPARVSMRGDGVALNFRNLAEGSSAILFEGSAGPQYGHGPHMFEGFEIFGPRPKVRHVTGLKFQTEMIAMSSRAQIRDCSIHDFENGVEFRDRAYLINFHHCSIYDCNFAVNCPFGAEDAGEKISFHQSVLFSCYCHISNTAGFELTFVACSLNYANRVLWDNNGQVDFVSCRVEILPPKEVPFHNGVGRTDFFGGFFMINGTHEPVVEELFAFNAAGSEVHMSGLRGWNWRTTTGRLTKGPGTIHWVAGQEITEAPAAVRMPQG